MISKDLPYLSNYPPLAEWLMKIDAHCVSQEPIGDRSAPLGYFETWAANGRTFIVEVRDRQRGWEIYTSANTNRIDETLRDAERRLGIAEKGF